MESQKLKDVALIATSAFTVYTIAKKIYQSIQKKQIEKKKLIDLIGNTHLIYLESLSKLTGCEIYAKCEFMNPGGSIKDRTCKQIILDAIKDGELSKEKKFIYEGTSGSTGISLTQLGNSMGFQTKIFLPDDLAQEKYLILETMKAILVKVKPCSIVDSQHYCKLAENQAEVDGAFFSDQFENLSNFKVHYNSTAKEIYTQTHGQIDIFVSGSGTGGTIAGVSRYIKSKKPQVKVILADPQGSSLRNKVNYGICYTGEEAEGHRLKHPFDTITEGIGLNRQTDNFNEAQIDKAFLVTDEEALEMAHFLIQNEGLFLGSSSAVNACAAVKSARLYGKGKTIVTIFCDSGMRYLSKFYNPQYLESKGRQYTPKDYSKEFNLDFVL
ncbi:pyridoxal-phosphate-dependent protein (macronuclear) [Tetrahymena thermophila SB210]|uniref:Pyridoxal-phosphate-dependent protein n=1 Tax=Tetrahymena thermophila (strain SB210) TaxID=312017 RepID=I7MEH4_TETTS|nr:pyridoxal-phosphate-dependent protein [Tetrahymena thermophila SB210]EAR96363.1 pyridoxal-phosphate-dependent protein [Tetrahymena thermophila SB210]UWK23373.1 Cysteine synthase 2 [Tetrahymena thermophila]|eukprot:XP_001016608.1 pyridoxal-phosphate-dependent protein [Tetrahymena thermophila SB210]